MSDVETLITALEQLDLSGAQEDTERLAGLVLERQEILGRLESAGILTLEPGLRAALGARIRDVLTRDEEVLERLVQIRERTRDSLDALHHGRAATRGYGVVGGTHTLPSKRVG